MGLVIESSLRSPAPAYLNGLDLDMIDEWVKYLDSVIERLTNSEFAKWTEVWRAMNM